MTGFYHAFWAAFSGAVLTFDDAFADGDQVAIRFTLEAVGDPGAGWGTIL